MNALHEWLHLFSDSIRENDVAIKNFSENATTSNLIEKLAIYQQNHFGNITQALQSTYGVLHQLMGEGRFKAIAHGFIKQYPPIEANINRYGAEFAEFIENEPLLKDYPYLSGVAELEWAAHTAFLSPLAEPIDMAVLGVLSDESVVDLKITLAPSVSLICSDYPVLAIWQANQPGVDSSDEVKINKTEEQLLIMRENDKFSIQLITKAEYELLASIEAGSYFNDSIQLALGVDEQLDIGQILQQYILQGVFSGIKPVTMNS